jgi:predicted YcjX-like family ATPase
MSSPLTTIADEARIASRALWEFSQGLMSPTLRLGVTGLSRAGKTVFISALVRALTQGGRLPVFEPMASGRLAGATLRPQPDDAVPRFEIERHTDVLTKDRLWPTSTRQVSELRLVIDYASTQGLFGSGNRQLTLDIVDYPGEWLLDLPLLGMSYAQWSADTLKLSRDGARQALAGAWHSHLATLDATAPDNETEARKAASLFTDYLRACRDDRFALSLLPPGRFLMPGDLEGSPALTFAPLDLDGDIRSGSMGAMMERRFEAYKDVVVRPFFRDHFARLDRQIVLVDMLAALNAGRDALTDLERALGAILDYFRVGRNSWLSNMLRPRVDRILFAATKADHLHHASHDRLEAILRRLVDQAITRAEFAGAGLDVVALAAIRATREATLTRAGQTFEAILGTPLPGERAGPETFDGLTEIAVFPGDLPADPKALFAPGAEGFRSLSAVDASDADYRFIRFRPPVLDSQGGWPNVRLDRALQFLIGDRLA